MDPFDLLGGINKLFGGGDDAAQAGDGLYATPGSRDQYYLDPAAAAAASGDPYAVIGGSGKTFGGDPGSVVVPSAPPAGPRPAVPAQPRPAAAEVGPGLGPILLVLATLYVLTRR